MPAAGGEASQVTDNGGWEALESWDGRLLYYSKAYMSPLLARPVAGGPEKQVLESVTLLSFMVAENGIYYVWKPGAGRSGIKPGLRTGELTDGAVSKEPTAGS